MIDKKYTNKDIISSLEVIATTCNCNECKIRNCKWGTCNCSQITANAALSLINQQQAEIERLKSVNDEKFRQWDMLAEMTKQHYADLYEEARDTLKAESYKKFAERLVYTLCINNEENTEVFDYAYTLETINNLVKELISDE